MKKVLLFVSVILFNMNTQAALINAANYIQDSETNLDWLKLSNTIGKSYSEVLELINTDPTFGGYQYASRSQVWELFNNHYGTDVLPSDNDDLDYHKTYSFVQLLGATQLILNDPVPSAGGLSEYRNVYGILAQTARPEGYSSPFSVYIRAVDFVNEHSSQDYGTINPSVIGGVTNHEEIHASFLVRASTVNAVQEPPTTLMFLIGMLFISATLRYKNY